MKTVYHTKEVAEKFNISYQVARKHARAMNILRIGKNYLWKERDIENLMKEFQKITNNFNK